MRDRLTASAWWTGIFLGLGSLLVTVSVVLASGGGEAAHGAAHAGHGITPEKIQDFIWRTLNFVVFAAILIKLAAKPAKAFFSKRSTDIGESFEDLEAKKAAAEGALRAAEARLADVASEREKLLEQFMAEGEAEKKKIIEKAEMVAERIKEMAQLSIQQETKKATQELKKEVAEKATQMAEALIQKEITSTDQTKLVEEYLNKVVEKH
jgi:F-type H+-transporting ATPase subunit b